MNKKYLDRCEPDAIHLLKVLPAGKSWDHYLAIPCCGESELLPQTIASVDRLSFPGRLLLVLTINETPHTDVEYKHSNAKTLEWLGSKYDFNHLSEQLALAELDSFDIILINRTKEFAFPDRQGVGLARKIGNDVGFVLYAHHRLQSCWLHNSDGDAIIPQDLLIQSQQVDTKTSSAIVFNYEHIQNQSQAEESHWRAAVRYEIWLRYYVLGLAYANSPFAFPTIGSTITINAASYSLVHGFPKRVAGEDFYLLNKLAKIGQIQTLTGQPIILNDRRSHRVPFGTGQGTHKIETITAAGENYSVYHPQCFDDLKSFLAQVVRTIAQDTVFDYTQLQKTENAVSEQFVNYLQSLDISKVLADAKQRSKSVAAYRTQFFNWFDAFRTLKAIHFLRDEVYGSVELIEALKLSPFLPPSKAADEEGWLKVLRRLERDKSTSSF